MGDKFNKEDRKSGSKAFKKVERLKRKRDFERLRIEGKRIHSSNYVLLFLRNNLPHNRLAISISKKVGNAVIRNYEKRICREIYRDIKNSLPVGFDFLLIVKVRTYRKSKEGKFYNTSSGFLERKKELKRLFEKVR